MSTPILFFGTPDFAVPTLGALVSAPELSVVAVVTQPDRRQGRGKKLSPSPVKRRAEALGIPVIQPENIRKEKEAFLESLQPFGPIGIGVVVAFGQILPDEILSYPEHGCLNIHGSLLPRWRGAAPMQRAIMAGDAQTGICIMQMDEGLDTGPVFSRFEVPITDSTTLQTLHDTLASEGAKLLMKTIPRVLDGRLHAEPQSSEGISHAKKISPGECQIQWAEDAATLSRLIRGISPFPGAFTFFDERRIKIFDARAIEGSGAASGLPGEIICCEKGQLEVQCGTGVLQILEAQLEGKKRLPTDQFLRGLEVTPGDVFT